MARPMQSDRTAPRVWRRCGGPRPGAEKQLPRRRLDWPRGWEHLSDECGGRGADGRAAFAAASIRRLCCGGSATCSCGGASGGSIAACSARTGQTGRRLSGLGPRFGSFGRNCGMASEYVRCPIHANLHTFRLVEKPS